MEPTMNRSTSPIQKMKPTDILAVIVILGSFTLIGLGHDGVINSVLMAVVAFYFGIKTGPPKD